MAEPFLRLERISKSFGANQVVREVDLAFERGEFISLLGPSGCGKSTILRMIAGFEQPSEGRIVVDGRDITGLKPNQRKLGMVFQSYALFPNLNVGDNIGFGLKVAGASRDQIRVRVGEMLALIGLSGFEKRFPFEMSGGQQQRVALARALAPRPTMLLLDEPLSALDAKIRVSLRSEIRAIQRELGITTIFVTHDQEEALSISDRVVVLNAGRVEQAGAPFEIYNRPRTRFVAAFVGIFNALAARIEDAGTGVLSVDGQPIVLPRLPAGARSGSDIVLNLRPEAVSLGCSDNDDITLEGTVSEVNFLGSVIRLTVDLGQNRLSLDTFNDQHTPPPALGQRVQLGIASSNVLVLDER